ncbi:sentrin-specific protease 5-like isoform X1 [Seriola lalandi dorsalis]|uniref:sentrin-specific protease 5-like n=1 Tax=Seriola aureovittata TaxID=2871759 RepID=UPI000C6F476F|nr:sentrin-specific protease 5-like isoform X1 [Seriola lalandi dorsalis]XP_023260818.1 sentrin-specific protease 5-like isoform X1 [Seriola lalandi dorsalis]XP_023260819.1 sentrin-specific protease 5-like isoform X1 [Seriola lalandi dorsalis]XP_023260820.1 sentrin-specific protease 5-like isoform X1 [Seriola lalandi dorsalis]XP_056246337.1 sentrin-specific protease 5-like [Seriola aureovittata]XP_056246338.1 sentrin-specific protease 5-like [Seriola aureovittata]XP_056246339.1 sentrin-specif
MHRTQSHRSKAKYLKRKKGFMSSVKGVSHLSRRTKRRLYCKLQLWMWRKRREKCRFGIYKAKKRACGISSGSSPCLSLKAQSQKNKRKVPMYRTLNLENSQARASSVVSPIGGEASEDTLRGEDCLLKPRESVSLSETFTASSSLHDQVTDTNAAAATITQTIPSPTTELFGKFCEIADPSKCSCTVKPLLSTEDSEADRGITLFKAPRTMIPPQRLEVNCPSGQHTNVTPGQDQAQSEDTDERFTSNKSSVTDVGLRALTKDIHEFLDGFYRIYGSFIPLQKSDVLRHLKRKFNSDFSDRKNIIFSEVTKYRTAIVQKLVPSFQVVYKKHTLTLDDLLTLADQNWLNDQVMNMYGELIVESASHKVHFLNSFFHRQLMTKGYDGVKRWTKQVDLFSKSLLLVPIHLEVHWCLVTADFVKKKICLYDSQGNALQKVARNILKYLMTEAKEKQQTAFENGWAVSFDEKIPQQTNENDCGVFVLEYSRCLALAKPLQFSQEDIPKIRKRIYKELCDCKLHEEG